MGALGQNRRSSACLPAAILVGIGWHLLQVRFLAISIQENPRISVRSVLSAFRYPAGNPGIPGWQKNQRLSVKIRVYPRSGVL